MPQRYNFFSDFYIFTLISSTFYVNIGETMETVADKPATLMLLKSN